MGIRGFYKYIHENQERLLETYELQNTKLIIDGLSVRNKLYDEYKGKNVNNDYNLGGIYRNFAKYVTHFFNYLIHHNVDILVVLNGTWEPGIPGDMLRKMQKDIQDFKEEISGKVDLLKENSGKFRQTVNNKKDLFYIKFINEVFFEVIKELKIKFLRCTFNANNTIATMAKILNYPVLATDSDFYIYCSGCIIFSTLRFDSRNDSNGKITCKILRQDVFVRHFPGLDTSCLVFLAFLLSGNYFTDHVLGKFLNIGSLHTIKNSIHVKFEAALNWLRSRTLHLVAQEILSLMISIGFSPRVSKKLIEESVNKYLAISTYMLPHLTNQSSFSINDRMIHDAKNKFFKFTFYDKNESRKDINRNDANDHYIKRNDDETKKKFESSLPGWFINNYLMGSFNSYVINLIQRQTYISLCQWENINYPSIYESSIPLISLIYSLMMTCTNVEELKPLKICIRKNADACCKELHVMKYPFQLDDIRKADITIRLNIINHALNINDATILQELPQKWRLFVATAIFWMKHEGEPVKNKIHLHVLLLALLSTFIKEKIRDSIDNDFFGDGLRKKGKKMFHSRTAVENQSVSILETLKGISYDDAIVMASDYLPIFGLRDFYPEEIKNTALIKLSDTTIHIYQQFQCCLEHAKNINALLDFPYYQPNISEIFNGSLIYNLSLNILLQSISNNHYISYKLKSMPKVFEVFKLIRNKVDSLLL